MKVSKKITGVSFKTEEISPREGDPPIVVADSSKAKKEFNWQPQYNDIEFIIKTAWEWMQKQ